MSWIILLVGFGIVLLGFFFYKKHKDLRRACTMRTTGKVIRMERREEIHTDTDSDGHTTRSRSITYYPVFQYTVDGRDIEKTSTVGTNRPRFNEGQTVSVMYVPNRPERFYIAEDKADGRFGIYLMLFGVLVFVMGIVSLFVPISS